MAGLMAPPPTGVRALPLGSSTCAPSGEGGTSGKGRFRVRARVAREPPQGDGNACPGHGSVVTWLGHIPRQDYRGFAGPAVILVPAQVSLSPGRKAKGVASPPPQKGPGSGWVYTVPGLPGPTRTMPLSSL